MSTPPLAQSDWRKVRKHVDARIAELHGQLERLDLDERASAIARGRIAELRGLIAWGEPSDDGKVEQLASFDPGY